MFIKDKIKNLHYVVSGVITAGELRSATDNILTEHGKTAKIAGFRPGHIPLDILRARFGSSATGEAIDCAVNADLNKYITDKKIRLAGAPNADIKEVVVGKDIDYILEFDVLPELPEFDLAKYTVTKKIATVPDSEIEKALTNVRKSRAQAIKQDTGYKAVDGDLAVIDFKGFLGKEAFEGGEAKNHRIIIGSGSFIPGFEEKLIGHAVGDKFDIKVKFPKDYHADNLAGADAKFEIQIHELRHHDLPELNDELAKEVGIESVIVLCDHIKKTLTEQYEDVSKRIMRNELLDTLADKIKMDLPEVLIKQECDMAKSEFEKHKNHEHATGKKWDEKSETLDAARRVKLGLILAEWGNKNGIKVENADLQKAIWEEAARYPDPSQVFDFYNKNQNAMSMIRGMLFEQKALDAMIAKVTVKEKTVKPEELFKQADVK